MWAPDSTGTEQVYQVPLTSYATPVAGSYNCAYANFTLSGTLTAGDFVGIAYLENSITYQVGGWEGSAAGVLAQIVLAYASDPLLRATSSGDTLTVYYTGGVDLDASPTTGANGNTFGVYSFACSATGGDVDTELGFGGADTGERDLSNAVAGDDSISFAFGLYRSGLYDAARDHESARNPKSALDLHGGFTGGLICRGASSRWW